MHRWGYVKLAHHPKTLGPLHDQANFVRTHCKENAIEIKEQDVNTHYLNTSACYGGVFYPDAFSVNLGLMVMDTRPLKYYYRLLPDNRLLFGGRGAIEGKDANKDKYRRMLISGLAQTFPLPFMRRPALKAFYYYEQLKQLTRR